MAAESVNPDRPVLFRPPDTCHLHARYNGAVDHAEHRPVESPCLIRLEDRSWYADVRFRGVPKLIACGVLETRLGLILIDPGPASTLDSLSAALVPLGGLERVTHVLLTHIHLDHAGACGLIVRRHPHIQIVVHPIGAPHLIRPARLIQSAQRIYGNRLDSLWGPILPVPAAQVESVTNDAEILPDGRRLHALYTPGHASHHIAWHDRLTNVLFAGDAAGMRVLEAPLIIPVAPPPDIDLELWDQSLELLATLETEQLFLTHFGPVSAVRKHLEAMYRRLHAWSEAVKASLALDSNDHERAAEFHEAEMSHARASVPPDLMAPYTIMGQPSGSWYGLARYWRKKPQNSRV